MPCPPRPRTTVMNAMHVNVEKEYKFSHSTKLGLLDIKTLGDLLFYVDVPLATIF